MKNTSIFFFFLLCLACKEQVDKLPKNQTDFLIQKFNYHVSENSIITTHTRSEVQAKKRSQLSLQYPNDSIKVHNRLKRFLKRIWPSKTNNHIKKVYTYLDKEKKIKHGFYVEFQGDSNRYTYGFYKKNKKDSIQITVINNITIAKTTFINGESNFPSFKYYSNGSLEAKHYRHKKIKVPGINPDGVVNEEYYPSGQIKSFFIMGHSAKSWYENGEVSGVRSYNKSTNKLIETCYDKKGTIMSCGEDGDILPTEF